MHALSLAYYDIKRIVRRRALWVALVAAPLALAASRAVFCNCDFFLYAAWCCPVLCAALTWSVLYMQRAVDEASGLLVGLRSSPLSDSALVASRVLAGAFIFAVQMGVFAVVLAARF